MVYASSIANVILFLLFVDSPRQCSAQPVSCVAATGPTYIAGSTNSLSVAISNAIANQAVDVNGFKTVCVDSTVFIPSRTNALDTAIITTAGLKLIIWAGVSATNASDYMRWDWYSYTQTLLRVDTSATVYVYGARIIKSYTTTTPVTVSHASAVVYLEAFTGSTANTAPSFVTVSAGVLSIKNANIYQGAGVYGFAALYATSVAATITLLGSVSILDTWAAGIYVTTSAKLNVNGVGNIVSSQNPRSEFAQLHAETAAIVTINGVLDIADSRDSIVLSTFSCGFAGYQATVELTGTLNIRGTRGTNNCACAAAYFGTLNVREGALLEVYNNTGTGGSIIRNQALVTTEYLSTILVHHNTITVTNYYVFHMYTGNLYGKIHVYDNVAPNMPGINFQGTFFPTSALSIRNNRASGVFHAVAHFGGATIDGCIWVANNTGASVGVVGAIASYWSSKTAVPVGITSFCQMSTRNIGPEVGTDGQATPFACQFFANGADQFAGNPVVIPLEYTSLTQFSGQAGFQSVISTYPLAAVAGVRAIAAANRDVCGPGETFDVGGCRPPCATGFFFRQRTLTCTACNINGVQVNLNPNPSKS